MLVSAAAVFCFVLFFVRRRNFHVWERRWDEGLLSDHVADGVLSSRIWFVESYWGQPVTAGAIAAASMIGRLVDQSQLSSCNNTCDWSYPTCHSWCHCSSINDWSPLGPITAILLQQHLWLVVSCWLARDSLMGWGGSVETTPNLSSQRSGLQIFV